MGHVKALQGQWYSDRYTREIFCVIGIDEDDGLIDVRDGYGDIDEFDYAEWESMDLELCSAPESWQLDPELDEESGSDEENGPHEGRDLDSPHHADR